MSPSPHVPQHAFGLIPDHFDPRDQLFEAAPQFFIGAIPPSIDLRELCSPVRDQGQLGACTGFAITAMREFWELKCQSPTPMVVLSPLFVYYQERLLENTINQDAGAMIRDGMKVLTKIGVCPEVDMPYDITKFTQAPLAQAVADAAQFLITSYKRVTTLNGLKHALAGGTPAVLGIRVYASFESQAVAQTGVVPMPGPNEQLLGGHAVLCVGYKDDSTVDGGGSLIVKNSWSDGWGDKGYFYLPYAYVQPKLMTDIWTATV